MSRTYRNFPFNINLNKVSKPYKFTRDFGSNNKEYKKFKRYIHSQICNKIKINLKGVEDYDNFIPNKTIYI